MTAPDDLLFDLLLGLFRSDAELQRFLVLQNYPVQRLVPTTKATPTLSSSARAAAQGLVELGLADDRLFAALRTRAPERTADIDAVADALLTARDAACDDAPPAAGADDDPADDDPADDDPADDDTADDDTADDDTADPGEDAEVAEFRRLLQADLAAVPEPDPVGPALTPDRWPWTGAAAVFGSFRPAPLTAGAAVLPALAPLPGVVPAEPAPVALAAYVRTLTDGSWVLRDEIRLPALRRLVDDGDLRTALAANAALPDARRDVLRTLTEGGPVRLFALDAGQLDDVDVVSGWLERVAVPLPLHRADVHAAAERRRLIDPLRALVGTHFRGREQELARLRAHLRPDAGTPTVLRVHGPGGVGKSSLVGRLLLDLEERIGDAPTPYAYLDFDRPQHDPRNPAGLVEQIARQLRLLYAGAAEAGRFAAVEAASAGTDTVAAAEILEVAPGLDLDGLVDAVARALRERQARSPDVAELVLVLDTFEEVQAKGPGAVADVLALVDRLAAALPGLRVVVVGRSVLALPGDDVPLVLGDLDPLAADAVLVSRGVADPTVRELIVDRFGGNPLTLRLAAEALARSGSVASAFDGVVGRAEALAEVALTQIQGMLYGRILGHIGDPEVVRVAHPGLAVRLVTGEVLREVLAVPCGLDPDRAEIVLDRLRREVTLFEPADDGALRHRQDVRVLMLRTMGEEPARAAQVADIHRRAVAFYAARPGAPARAEELYHRLMSGDDPRPLDTLWRAAQPAKQPPSLDEPLPARARIWVQRRLGLAPEAGRDEWDQEDWEADAALRATSWLASRAPRSALAVLDERTVRQPGSRLPALEVAAATASGDLDRAARVLDAALPAAVRDGDRAAQLDLVEQAVVLRARQGDADGVAAAARAAVAVADLTGERVRALESLVRAVSALDARGDAAAAELAGLLARRFGTLDGPALRAAPETVRRVLHAVGVRAPGVLRYAAVTVGDDDRVFVPDAFALARLLGGTAPAAEPALVALARAVGSGTPDPRGDALEVTRRAIRLGRVGAVVAVGLDHAADPSAAAALIVTELVAPVEQEGPDAVPLPG